MSGVSTPPARVPLKLGQTAGPGRDPLSAARQGLVGPRGWMLPTGDNRQPVIYENNTAQQLRNLIAVEDNR